MIWPLSYGSCSSGLTTARVVSGTGGTGDAICTTRSGDETADADVPEGSIESPVPQAASTGKRHAAPSSTRRVREEPGEPARRPWGIAFDIASSLDDARLTRWPAHAVSPEGGRGGGFHDAGSASNAIVKSSGGVREAS